MGPTRVRTKKVQKGTASGGTPPPRLLEAQKNTWGGVYFTWSGEIFLRNFLPYPPPKYSRVKGGGISKQRKFYIFSDGPHTRLAAARLFLRFTRGEGYYPFPEAEMASKYREESSNELILKLTGLRQVMPPCAVLGLTKSL